MEELATSSPNVDAAKVLASLICDDFAGADLETVMSVFMVDIKMSFFSLAGAAFTVLLALSIPLKGLEY